MPTRCFSALTQLATAHLTPAEQFVLGACRCWDAFMYDPDRTLAWRELAPVFAYMNVLNAMCAFDRTFECLHRYQPQRLHFQDTDCELLGPDEAKMLCCLACLQRGHARATINVLSDALPHRGIRAVLPPLARIAAILDAQGHRLPAWEGAPRESLSGTA
jgi:hypothetical protein